MTASDAHRVIDAVWKFESARIIVGLTRIVRDVGVAEELAQDALVIALEKWPESGVPNTAHREQRTAKGATSPRYSLSVAW